jgi:hypothetical protein
MDWIFASLCWHVDERLFKVMSYNIACQWWKNLFERLLKLPLMMRMMISMAMIRFIIPKMHIKLPPVVVSTLQCLHHFVEQALQCSRSFCARKHVGTSQCCPQIGQFT